ncbi:MAG: tRNA 2-selenouridine(34) synthase MnmH [Ginsengibacter sp.]
MPVEKTDIENFLTLSLKYPVLDVRSPAEYLHAHIPGAFSVPVFTDEQRAIIGTAYVQQNRQIAVDYGLNYFSERMKIIPGEALNVLNHFNKESSSSPNTFLIHCWRGGMRSDAVAWLLNLYGYKIYLLKGGYKAFRKWAFMQFEKKYCLKILGGFTGSGKTEILKELKQEGRTVIDLERLANHRGSAFGALGENRQPSHEMFENMLALELWKISQQQDNGNAHTKINPSEIWLEDESIHIGRVGIPKTFWQQMRNSPLYFLDIPFEERVKYIANHYGSFDKEEIIACILKIQKRLGGLNTKNAIQFLNEDNATESFGILLKYYDEMYTESLQNRPGIAQLLTKINCCSVDPSNAGRLTG